ncbi:30S ribosomal protein S8 [Candidatus Roizmanbacteria bacterium RIFCSPLOWO2_01_FULL_42_14]|uniref:Small ribosomal subunit protein uS8 n=4 Tax=Candidatus Roizmaniibacteriota TaxID=1752723 RepID=A0A1F7JUZ9_9BACT|nr:MAG: 30S ribosomal protein S8 [Candidatus Roizmanbacteria bacterium RIFCSPHIGHO2_02_FULL_43_11]OGK38607.1 MAG: 30S ribosomal protein S8 [Candidatus Roizmanbacteria bacterium RIFCSPHIGHO2_12_FULL_42_10]OGK52201.1 MAG: 30S ribosomal protein S8 [Candidatus Roizmanbacteria bacterium RIFCSPLOWO2_01_FULL_42_14]OGK59434.1 MAG: 30S ribosomal protein S8 [Candidatus Roizmanbacteria bacterium RIFCSPLOWO2_02_FULL_43_10]
MSAHIDLAIRIKNGYLAQKDLIEGTYSRLNENIVAILKEEGYIKDFEVKTDKNKSTLAITLLYRDREPAVQNIKIHSRPGQRRYAKMEEVKSVRGGLGVALISTPKGVMTDRKSRAEKIGGEVLLSVW